MAIPSYIPSLVMVLTLLSSGSCMGQLSSRFYSSSCPSLLSTAKSVMKSSISKEKHVGASVLRLFFHDCFVNGCDGSLLLDDTSRFIGEKTAVPNIDSLRGFHVIDEIKSAVEEECPDVVSCADILAIAARDSVSILGGPRWDVKLGRRDARIASKSAAESDLPPPTANLSTLISSFKAKGLSTTDLVALSGAHTIGQAQCKTFRDRIHNETNIDSTFALRRQRRCPEEEGSGDDNLAPLDRRTPRRFDNRYFTNLVNKRGLLHSDQELYNHGSTDSVVLRYSRSSRKFNSDFVDAMIKMGDISPLTGSRGEIRKNCRVVNPSS